MRNPEHLAGFQMTIAVFTSAGGAPVSLLDLVFVHLEADTEESEGAKAVARGGRYAGCFAVMGGKASVQIESGFEAEMVYAGAAFCELLGPHLKRYQLGQTPNRH